MKSRNRLAAYKFNQASKRVFHCNFAIATASLRTWLTRWRSILIWLTEFKGILVQIDFSYTTSYMLFKSVNIDTVSTVG